VAERRFGLGFDVHPRDDTRPLSLGGVAFEDEPGLAGHSDADVICHALAQALLGAAALGDLGDHLPDTDPANAGLAGLDLLGRILTTVREAGFEPESCDLTLVAERPLLAPKRDEVRRSLAGALGVDASRVSVKATRPEGLGLSGDGAGCLALATVVAG
jgi:2-C-methyl-D-erythritol 2,4-cyclodiphosphate synthase